ncbi:MAG: lipopolysaccharide heptosyltransferase I [Nitrospiraceae bacterium]|nr:lipopolysaccharide heptosyltransferase I [Nitrospiraceae bacterium]
MAERSLQTSIKNKILVIKPSSLGDVIHSLPFLYSIKEQLPQVKVHWVIAGGLAPLLEGHPLIDRLWTINKDEWKRPSRLIHTAREFMALSKALKKERFDAVFDLQGLLRSAAIAAMAGAGSVIGFSEAREGGPLFYTHKVSVAGKKMHAVERYLKMAEFAGITPKIEFPLPEDIDFAAPLGECEYAVIAPGARWPSKRWPASKWGELAKSFLPLRSLVIGAESDTGLALEVASASGGAAVPFAGKSSLKGLVEIIRRAKFMVTNDSGPMHIAAALQVPVFAVFGPTDPELTGPYGKGPRVVISQKAGCSPCRNRTCKKMICMDAVSVEMVEKEIKKAL